METIFIGQHEVPAVVYNDSAILRYADIQELLNITYATIRGRIKKLKEKGNWNCGVDYVEISSRDANCLYETKAYTNIIHGFKKSGFKKIASMSAKDNPAVADRIVKEYYDYLNGENELEFIDGPWNMQSFIASNGATRRPAPIVHDRFLEPEDTESTRSWTKAGNSEPPANTDAISGWAKAAKKNPFHELASQATDDVVKDTLLLLAGINEMDCDSDDKSIMAKKLLKEICFKVKKKHVKALTAMVCGLYEEE